MAFRNYMLIVCDDGTGPTFASWRETSNGSSANCSGRRCARLSVAAPADLPPCRRVAVSPARTFSIEQRLMSTFRPSPRS